MKIKANLLNAMLWVCVGEFLNCAPAPSASGKIKLVLATHWTDYQRAAINRYLEEYMRLHAEGPARPQD